MDISPTCQLDVHHPCLSIRLIRSRRNQRRQKADLILVDLEHETKIDASKFESMGKNTPFDQQKVHAQIVETYVDGQRVWKG